ncbi:hypothetical protein [Chitinophaga rhizophila]|uniref:Integrase-like protein n=1 Tax=Chitinophaga rhizophila TaxID=2866212 RepID=A0ABS7GAI6_9BACT|nr:hypothetical protein [Chitinophaga rhizophila]MBW8684683.1 hypothetical protein [Chitinophaga rhizophila]
MAKTSNPLLNGYGVSNAVTNKKFIIKKYKSGTVICKYPDMSGVVRSGAQLDEQSRFKAAVKYAKSIVSDPVLKAQYKPRPGSSVYHSAIKDYLNG